MSKDFMPIFIDEFGRIAETLNNGVTLCKTCHKELHRKLNSTKRGGN